MTEDQTMQYESQLIPILREGVDIIKMILFKNLRDLLSRKYPDRDPRTIGKLSGVVINDLFGTPNPDPAFVEFERENKGLIEAIIGTLATELELMRIPLTDGLRVQFLCDHQEGIDSTPILQRAKEANLLLVEREVPLPAKFMSLVRKLGGAYDLIVSPEQPTND